MLDDVLNEINVLLRARYPIIYIVSSEEHRVIKYIKSVATYPIYIWSLTMGMRHIDDLDKPNDLTKDPFEAIKFIAKLNDNGLFILLDYAQVFLKEHNPEIIRYFRELSNSLKYVRKNIILLSPNLTIPLELEKEITVVDFPLPDISEINKTYMDIAKALGKELDIKINTNGNKEHVCKGLRGLTIDEIEHVLYKSVVKHGNFNIQTIVKEKKQIIRKSGILEYFDSDESLGSIGGLESLKTWITDRKNAFTNKAKEYGLPYPKGILLLGVQGCGKSLTCKVISRLWNFPLLKLDMGSVFGSLVGESEQNVRKVLKLAESVSPCILWIDEIEKGLAGVSSSNFSDSGTTARVFSTILTWLQEKDSPVFVAVTANDVSNLPPELLRKGRFDEIFFVDLPDLQERMSIFEIHLSKRGWKPNNFNIEKLSRSTDGFSGAEIEALIESAMHLSFKEDKDLSDSHILEAKKYTVPLSKTMEEKINAMREWCKNRARWATPDINEEKPKMISIDFEDDVNKNDIEL